MKIITDDGEIIDEVTTETVGMAPPFFKTPFNHDTNLDTRAGALVCREPSKTQQQFAHEADINVILAKFLSGGDLPLTGPPSYQNFEREFDLQQEMVTGWEVQQAWDSLSPEIRNTLKDPRTFVKYVEHCLETGDLEPLEKIGLAKAKVSEPPLTPVVSPAPGAEKAPSAAPQKTP